MIFKIQRDWLFLTANVAKCKTIKLLIYRWREIFKKRKKKKKRKKIIKDEQWFERVASWKQTLVRQSSCSTAGIIRIWRMQNRQWRARVKLCMPRINGPQYANVYKVSGTFCQPLFPGLWKPDRELAYPTSLSAFHSVRVTFRETKPKFPLHVPPPPITDRRFLPCQPIGDLSSLLPLRNEILKLAQIKHLRQWNLIVSTTIKRAIWINYSVWINWIFSISRYNINHSSI